MYTVPEEYYFRLHHVRPRFKNDAESVLLYMASEISRIPEQQVDDYRQALNTAIRRYPGNGPASDKTIDNWRTEISSLFGLIERDGKLRKAGRMAYILAENQDLIEFFRYFLYYFQYPGGHLKPQAIQELIEAGINFKPAKYLIQVMLEGQKLSEGNFGLTKAEATHLIFNDMRVTRDGQSPVDTARKILALRSTGTEYDNDGDVTRYAGDILDYMGLADLATLRPNQKYYLNTSNLDVLQAFVSSDVTFEPYKHFYGKKGLEPADISETYDQWFAYVNNALDSTIFEADVLTIIEKASETAEGDQTVYIKEILDKLRERRQAELRLSTKEIGDVGESIVIEHERRRLDAAGRKELLHLVTKIPEVYAVGYDIGSYDGEGAKRRYVEVKTTVSRGELYTSGFHMTPSEWSCADSNGDIYYIYRLLISSEKVSLFLIQDPVGMYKKDLLDMVPRDGADIKYSEKSGRWEKLLA